MTDQPTTVRMLTIAGSLGELYKIRAALGLKEHHLNKDADERKYFITPLDGWPGKNAEQREAAKLGAELQDDTLARIDGDLDGIKKEASANNAAIETLESERRALEWQIRARLVDALSASRIQTDGDAKVEYAAFDDVSDDEAMKHAEAQLYVPYLNGKVWPAPGADSLAMAQAEQAIAEVDAEQGELDALRDKLAAQQALFDDDLPF